MSQLVTFNTLPGDMGKAMHNFSTHTFKIALTNTAPNVATAKLLANITQIAAGNGYVAGGNALTGVSYTETPANSGKFKFSANDCEFTASGGAVGPFRYAVIYNDTPADPVDPLICWWDYGSSISLANGEKFKVDFGASILTIA